MRDDYHLFNYVLVQLEEQSFNGRAHKGINKFFRTSLDIYMSELNTFISLYIPAVNRDFCNLIDFPARFIKLESLSLCVP